MLGFDLGTSRRVRAKGEFENGQQSEETIDDHLHPSMRIPLLGLRLQDIILGVDRGIVSLISGYRRELVYHSFDLFAYRSVFLACCRLFRSSLTDILLLTLSSPIVRFETDFRFVKRVAQGEKE